MKRIAAGLICLSALLIADACADPHGAGWAKDEHPRGHRHHRQGHCVTDFWGNCTGVYRRHGQCDTENGDNCTDAHHRHHRHGYCVTDTWGNCTGVYRRQPYWRHIRPRYKSQEGIGQAPLCHPKRRVVGEERGTKAGAQKSADEAWMGAVRYDHGERYQDLNNGKHVRLNCDPSSVTGVLKRTRFRCVLEATPCRAPLGASEEKVERRYEEDDDRK